MKSRTVETMPVPSSGRSRTRTVDRGARRDVERVMRRHLAAEARRVDRVAAAADDEVVDAVLEVAGHVRLEQAVRVRVVVAEQQARLAFEARAHRREVGDVDADLARAVAVEPRLGPARVPRPCVARPQLRQQVQRRGRVAAIDGGDAHQDVIGVGLRVLDGDVEVAIVVEDAGVDDLELAVVEPRASRSRRSAARTDTRPADTCRASACTNGSACRRRSSRAP